MKIKSLALSLISLLAISSCSYDDSELWDKVHSLESRVTNSESTFSAVNSEAQQLSTIIKNLEKNEMVKDIEKKDGLAIITFTNGTKVTLKDGISPFIGENGNWWIGDKDTSVKAEATDGVVANTLSIGENGHWFIGSTDSGISAAAVDGTDAPVMGIDIIDGHYYWTTTVNGKKNWLTDDSGNKINAAGINGITPVIRLNAEGYLVASYDGGISYSTVKDAEGTAIFARPVNGVNGNKGPTGDPGTSIFNSVYEDPSTGEVVFVMKDGNTYRFTQSSDLSRLEDVVVLTDGLGSFDEAYVSKEGYFLFSNSWSSVESGLRRAETRATSESQRLMTFLNTDMSRSACIFVNSKDFRPLRVAFDTWALEISYLDGSLAEIVYSDKSGYKYLETIEYDYTLWELEMRSAGISSSRIKATQFILNKLLTKLAPEYSDVEVLVSAAKAQLSKATTPISSSTVTLPKNSATGDYIFVTSAVKESIEIIFDLAYTLNVWTGKANFKVGGSSCTLEGSVLSSLDTFNDYGTYGMVCDTNISNLFVERAEYKGTGYQGAGDTYFEVDIRGLKPNTTYYYRSYYKFNGSNHGPFKFRYDASGNIYYDTEIKSFKTGDNILNVDVVMCIDVTGSMMNIINTVKTNALGFYDAFKKCCDNKGIILSSLTNQVIYFRDKNVDYDWIGSSPTYILPDQSAEFKKYVNNLRATGGGDTPESSLEALDMAFNKTDFGVDDGYHRQVIILWTDAPYLVGSRYTGYTNTMVEQKWNTLPSGRRMILFAPRGSSSSNGGNWDVMNSWKNVTHINDLYSGFNSLSYILESIVEELTGKGTSAPARVPLKAAENPDYFFRPNN